MAGEEHYARALSWLRMDLPKTPAAALKEWKRAGDLADVDPAVNEDLPAAERKQWQAFWADLDAVLAGASRKTEGK